MKKSVLVAILHQGSIRTGLGFFMAYVARDVRFNVSVKQYGLQPAQHNRNVIVKDFLKGEWDYLLVIDDDILPPRNILDLVLLDKDVIGGVCPQWRDGDMFFVVMDKVGERQYKQVPVERRGGLRRVEVLGTGCMLIKRKVLETIKAPFERKWGEDGCQEVGLDFYFCDKCREKEFEIWAHWDYPCGHKKSIDLLDVYKLVSKVKGDLSCIV